MPEIPRLSTGKPDLPAVEHFIAESDHNSLLDLLPDPNSVPESEDSGPRRDSGPAGKINLELIADRLLLIFAEILRRPAVTRTDSFVSLRGDSLSYVEVSVRLEQALGTLPSDWHLMSIKELAAHAAPTGPTVKQGSSPDYPAFLGPLSRSASQTSPRPILRLCQLETTVLLRAICIVLVVGSHVGVFTIRGGAHLMIAIAGYNFARFQLASPDRIQRLKHSARGIARIAAPTMIWLMIVVTASGQYSWANVFFLNNVLGPRQESPEWRYWFVEALVYLIVGAIALLSMPALHRAEVRVPFAAPIAMLGLGLLLWFGVIPLELGEKAIFTPWLVLWLFALGWAISRAQNLWQRLPLLAVTALAVWHFPGSSSRIFVILIGVAVLLWMPTVRVPPAVIIAASTLASASLYIYLTHWQVYPPLAQNPLLAVVASLTVGVGVDLAIRRFKRSLSHRTVATAQKPTIFQPAQRVSRLYPRRLYPRNLASRVVTVSANRCPPV